MRVALQLDAGSGLPVEPQMLSRPRGLPPRCSSRPATVEPLDPFVPAEVLDGIVDFWRSRSYSILSC
ncbi:MAG: hypothetical protein QM704_28165 [Anaeromyxobacteraceae bacterium]